MKDLKALIDEARRNERRTIVDHIRRVGAHDFEGANALLDMANEIERWPDPAAECRCVDCGRVAMLIGGGRCPPCAAQGCCPDCGELGHFTGTDGRCEVCEDYDDGEGDEA